MTLVLVAGAPRSGTTWLATVLAVDNDVGLVMEPDNQWTSAFAFRAKERLPGRVHPALQPGESAPEYRRLWQGAGAVGPAGGMLRPLHAAATRAADRVFAAVSYDVKYKAIISGRFRARYRSAAHLPRPACFATTAFTACSSPST